MVRRIPPKKLHPSNLQPLLPEGSTGGVVEITGAAVVTGDEGFSVVVEGIVVAVVGFSVEVVEGVVLSVVVVVEVEVETVVVLGAGVGEAEVLGVTVLVVSFSGVRVVGNFGGT